MRALGNKSNELSNTDMQKLKYENVEHLSTLIRIARNIQYYLFSEKNLY